MNNKLVQEKDTAVQNVNGHTTSESYMAYTVLQEPKRRFNWRVFLIYSFLAVVLVTSALIFLSSIKTAYFSSNSTPEEASYNINTIKSVCDNNESIKVESVTREISENFNIPMGVKIIELDRESPSLAGLKIDDIIVEISGKSVKSIDDIEVLFDRLEEENMITYRVYRNGMYTEINPYEQNTNDQ